MADEIPSGQFGAKAMIRRVHKFTLALDEFLHRIGINWRWFCDGVDNQILYGTWKSRKRS